MVIKGKGASAVLELLILLPIVIIRLVIEKARRIDARNYAERTVRR